MALHILVVDDDLDVLPVLVEMLQVSDFVVTSANSGIAMREILARDGLSIDAVVLDCGMPGESSAELALHAKGRNLPVVMISGNVEAMTFANENGLQLLTKPFRIADLVNAVNEAMGSGEFGQRGAQGNKRCAPIWPNHFNDGSADGVSAGSDSV
jgi:DNA-binding response OmpR family regulator